MREVGENHNSISPMAVTCGPHCAWDSFGVLDLHLSAV